MKYNLLLIGRNSFLSKGLQKSITIPFKKISFESFLRKDDTYLKKFTHLINFTSNPKFINNLYKAKYDHDSIIANKIKKLDLIFVFISTRKIYKFKANIRETDLLKPNCNYSKNKLFAENKIKEILKTNYLILRLSNVLGEKLQNKRKLHSTFIDSFLKGIKQNIIYQNPKIYKDFLTMSMFAKILTKLLKKNCLGTYNISFGKKVYLDKLLNWLNYYNTKTVNRVIFKKKNTTDNQDCFFLNNDKLNKDINLKFSIKTLEIECKKISKKIYNEK